MIYYPITEISILKGAAKRLGIQAIIKIKKNIFFYPDLSVYLYSIITSSSVIRIQENGQPSDGKKGNNMSRIGKIFLKLAVIFGASEADKNAASAMHSKASAAAKKKAASRAYSHCGCMDGDKIHVVKMMDSFDSEPTLMQMCKFHIEKATAAGKIIQLD